MSRAKIIFKKKNRSIVKKRELAFKLLFIVMFNFSDLTYFLKYTYALYIFSTYPEQLRNLKDSKNLKIFLTFCFNAQNPYCIMHGSR